MDRLMKTLFSLMLGAWAALIAWAIRTLVLNAVNLDPYGLALLDGGTVGLLAGAVIAGFEKYNNTSRFGPTALGMFVGLITGLIGGILGLLTAEFVFQNLRLSGDLQQILRVIGWGVFGLGVGIGPGIATGSLLKSLASSAGGCLGGIVGGGIFVLLLSFFARYVMTSSAVGFTLLGLFVGLLIALAQEVAKQAELKVVSSGPNEGKRFPIDKTVVAIGSASGNDWVISNDPILAPRHIEIRQERGKFVVHSKVAQIPAQVNRQPVQQQALKDGDRIRIGNTEIAFKARKA
jgi:hypothetical protein